MKLDVLATGSTGNCYILSNENHSIMLDCGIPFNQTICSDQFCGFKNLDLVFSSHSHKDHSRALKEFKLSGVNILSYEDMTIENSQPRKYGNWVVQPFPIYHNVPNWGLIIKAPDGSIICYCTDFNAMPRIENVDYWIYEINYDTETLERKALKEDSFSYSQVGFQNHNSLENAVKFFTAIKTKPKGIYICHMSLRHSNYKKIKRTMQEFCDNVEILQKGDVYVFNKQKEKN